MMFDFSALGTSEGIIALLTLTALEIVLGIDNVIFIAILSDKLPEEKRRKARNIGLLLAGVQRIVFLFFITWIIAFDENKLFTAFGREISVKDLIVLAGGLFLMWKAVKEIHEKVEGDQEGHLREKKVHTFGAVLMQIILIDAVFSIDSVLTAVGLTEHLIVMIIAVVVSVGIMIAFAGPIATTVSKHPTIKMLALAILLMIGVLLVAEAFGVHFDRGYVYFAMAFAVIVETLNILAGRKKKKKQMAKAADS